MSLPVSVSVSVCQLPLLKGGPRAYLYLKRLILTPYEAATKTLSLHVQHGGLADGVDANESLAAGVIAA